VTYPPPAPGWYPDPSGAAGQRYWDGKNWGPVAPAAPAAKRRGGARPFLLLAIVGAVVGVLAFVLMNLFFAGGGAFLNVLGFLAFAACICSVVATIVGVIGALSRRIR
jgi:hypothetical protein